MTLGDRTGLRWQESTEDTTEVLAVGEVRPAGLTLAIFIPGAPETVPLAGDGQAVIGRSSSCDIRIDAFTVSRRHALASLGGELWLEDLASNNGTYVDGRRLQFGERVRLGEGIRLRFGEVPAVLVGTVGRPPAHAMLPATAGAHDMVVRDASMVTVCEMIARLAAGTISVLVTGETGVGKERVAERIHHLSPRAGRPFLKLNCAAFTETLLDSELFGHERGAFTGATHARRGLLETASGGTVLLDEVGELSLPAQAKLLRCLEQEEVLPVGAVRPRPIDVRFIAATNRDLTEEVRRGAFREDLYYRIAGATIRVPPLRQRRGEIVELARLFAVEATRKLDLARVPSLTPEASQRLVQGAWPGNIRELRNIIERAVLLCGSGPIEARHLAIDLSRPSVPPAPTGDDEHSRIVGALEACGGNQTLAARQLGVSRVTLLRRLDRLGIPRPRKSRPPV